MLTEVARVVCSAVGLVVILAFFFKVPFLQNSEKLFTNWGIIISAFALGLGTVNLAKRHIERVVKRNKDWLGSAVCLTFLIVMSIIGIANGTGHPRYMWWFNGFFEAGQSTMGALIIFYITTSSFRAFRIRNVDASLLLIAGVICMMGQMPIGSVLSPKLPVASDWLMQVINVSGQRGIIVSAGLGAMAAGLRVILGVERGPFRKEGSG